MAVGVGSRGSLTDDELQRRLLGYQADVPPVTNSTRKVLERKLKRFETMQGFSSDDSETERRSMEPRRTSRRLSNRQTPSKTFVRPSPARSNHRASLPAIIPGIAGRQSLGGASPLLLDTSEDDSEDAGNGMLGRRVFTNVHRHREAAKTNGHSAPEAILTGDGHGDALLDGQFTTVEDLTTHNSNGSQCVSMVLVAVVAIFFAVVGSIYLGVLHKDASGSVVTTAPKFPAVTELEKNLGGEFADGKDVPVVLAAAHEARKLLRQRAGDYQCETHDTPNMMSSDLKAALDDKFHLSDTSFNNLLILFLKNPKWGVRVNTDDGDVYWLEAINRVEVSLTCKLRKYIREFFQAYFHLVLGLCCVAVITGCLYLWTARVKRERELVFSFVEKILDVLQRQHDAAISQPELKPFLAVPHVRDMLINPAERKKYRDAWNKAVRFVENNESRVRLESQIVEGEEFPVWRWVQAAGSEGSGLKRKKTKVWQGQAFENPDGGMNSLPCSPTPCLKIRSMFDLEVEYGDNWSLVIQDAILEKCGEGKIVHLKVDTTSKEGCVYLKCVDSEAAGAVYRALHGWWFDGKLVTVKYLRLERYHGRFPEAVGSHTPVKATGNAQ